MTRLQKQALETLMPKYSVALEKDESSTPCLFNFERIFGRVAPTFLEIGFGGGEALLAMAGAMPEKNFLGLEVYLPGIGSLLAALDRLALTNVRIIRADATLILDSYIAESSLDGVCIFFPDPWPKRRHHKRRLLQPIFVDLLRQKMKKNAILHIATDSSSYAEWILTVVTSDVGFENMACEKLYSPRPWWRPLTRFELKGLKQKNQVREFMFQKKEREYATKRTY